MKKRVFSLEKYIEWLKNYGFSLSEIEFFKNNWSKHEGREIINGNVDGVGVLDDWTELVELDADCYRVIFNINGFELEMVDSGEIRRFRTFEDAEKEIEKFCENPETVMHRIVKEKM